VNPHPCGFFGDPLHECSRTPPLIQRYLARISGPLLDRIDLHIQVPAVRYKELAQEEAGEDSAAIRGRILAAREEQFRRCRLPLGPIPAVRCVIPPHFATWLAFGLRLAAYQTRKRDLPGQR